MRMKELKFLLGDSSWSYLMERPDVTPRYVRPMVVHGYQTSLLVQGNKSGREKK